MSSGFVLQQSSPACAFYSTVVSTAPSIPPPYRARNLSLCRNLNSPWSLRSVQQVRLSFRPDAKVLEQLKTGNKAGVLEGDNPVLLKRCLEVGKYLGTRRVANLIECNLLFVVYGPGAR